MKITSRQYAEVLVNAYAQAAPRHKSEVVKGFIKFLIRRRAWKMLPRIIVQVEQLEDERQGIQRIHVWTASATVPGQLRTALHKLAKKVMMHHQHDPKLLGGATLRAGDTLIDASLAHQLKRLQTQLTLS